MRGIVAVVAFALCACGSRSELGIDDEFDASLPDASQDVALQDVTLDVVIDTTPVDASDGAVKDAALDVIETDGGPQCIPDCMHNFQCEVTCPPISMGRWCCDEQTNTCYAFAGKHCPNPIFDAGFD